MIDKTTFVNQLKFNKLRANKSLKSNKADKSSQNKVDENATETTKEQKILAILEQRFGHKVTNETEFVRLVEFIKGRTSGRE